MAGPLRFLIVDDSEVERYLTRLDLGREFVGTTLEDVGTAEGLARALDGPAPDLVVIDYYLGWSDGLAAAKAMKARWPDCPVIMLTGTGSESVAVEAMKAGLDDYVLKSPKHRVRLPAAVAAALDSARVRRELRAAHERLEYLVAEGPAVVYTCRPSGDFAATYVSGNVTTLVGHAAEAFVEDPDFWLGHVHPDHVERVRADRQRLPENGRQDLEYRFRDADGCWRWLHDERRVVRDARGEPVEIVGAWLDITDRKAAEDAAREAGERLRALSARLLAVQEEERRHLARELHDEVGQALTAVKMTLQGLRRHPGKQPPAQRIDEGIELVDRVLRAVRDLSLDLRPMLLDDLGLAPALRWYLKRVGQRATLAVDLVCEPEEPAVPAEVATTCFRLVQEALTNIVRHARARHVQVNLEQAGEELRLRVRDDGAGFDVAATRRRAQGGASLGLIGMEERVRLAGGRLEVDSAPDAGTEIRAWLPLGPGEAEAGRAQR